MKIVSSEQMRVLDNKAISEGTPGIELMERAGTGWLRFSRKRFPI